MTKLGFVMRGSVSSRAPTKRRKIRASSALQQAVHSSVVSLTDKDGNTVRYVAVQRKNGRFARSPINVLGKAMSCPPKIKPISSAESEEISFRMLSSLEDRIKEELFDVFE